jgi:hypothetical protein
MLITPIVFMFFSVLPLNWCTKSLGASEFYEEYPEQSESLRHMYEQDGASNDREEDNNVGNDNRSDPHKGTGRPGMSGTSLYNNQACNAHLASDTSTGPTPRCLPPAPATLMCQQRMHIFDMRRENGRGGHQNDVAGIDDDDDDDDAFDRERYAANQRNIHHTVDHDDGDIDDDDDAFDRERYTANQRPFSRVDHPANDHIPVRC